MTDSIRQRRLAIRLAALTALTPFAIDTYLPGMPLIAQDLNAPIASINLTISIYLLGFALGQLINGPLSDRLGRKPIAVGGLLLFIVCSIAISQASSATEFLWLRFLQALGGGGALVVSGAIVRDQFKGQDSAKVFSIIGMIMMIAPLIAPAVGSVILALSGWRAIFGFLSAYAGLLIMLVIFQIPETLVRKDTTPKVSLAKHYWDCYAAVFRATSALPHLFSQAFVSGILFTMITNASFIFISYFEVSLNQFPLYFAAFTGCSIIAGRANLHLLRRHNRLHILRYASLAQLLITACFGLYVLYSTPILAVVLLFLCLIVATIGLTYSNNLSMYLDHNGHTGGSANAIFGCTTFAAGGLLGGLSGLMHDGTLLPIVMVIIASSLASFVLLRRVAQVSD